MGCRHAFFMSYDINCFDVYSDLYIFVDMNEESINSGKKVWSNICTRLSLEEKAKVLGKAAVDGMNPNELLKYLIRDYMGNESSIQNKKRVETIIEVEKIVKVPEYLSEDLKDLLRRLVNTLKHTEIQRDNHHKACMSLKSRAGKLADYQRVSMMNDSFYDSKMSDDLNTEVERIIARYEDIRE